MRPEYSDNLAARVRRVVADRLLGNRLIVNFIRGTVAEAIVAGALEPVWEWCSEDWYGWDFVHGSGAKLEVKQSAAHQTWATDDIRPSRAIFDIGERKGRYDRAAWIAGIGRWADIYVFAHHPVVGEQADHCDPEQWLFYAVRANTLPAQATISLSKIQKLAEGVGIDKLRNVVEELLAAAA